MPYGRIMVAVDGSETSEQAVIEATKLTKLLHAKLCIIHAIDEFPLCYFPGDGLIEFKPSQKNQGEEILKNDRQLSEQNGIFPEIQLATISPMGSKKVSEKIVETAEDWKADLLVIGTHGRRGFNRFLMGSVAEETLRISTIPVLLIRAKE